MQSRDGMDKCQPYRCSILSDNYNGEPIAFEWKIFAGTTAFEILQKIQKDFEGQRIKFQWSNNLHVHVNDIDLDREGTKTVAISIRERSKCMRQDSQTDTEYSWVLEKKASGRSSPIVEEFESSGNPVFKGASPLGRGTLKMRSGRNTIHLNGEFGNIDFLFRTVHAANQLCFYGAVTKLCEKQPEADSGKASKGRPESARRTPREIQIKQEERKSLVDIPRIPLASRNRML